jgi:predicted small lipoprotein YifL
MAYNIEMKIKNQHKSFFTVLILGLVLAGCGLKGRLYQTPDAEPTEKSSTDISTDTSTDISTEMSEEKIQKSESAVQADEALMTSSGSPEQNKNANISKEHE